MVQNKKLSKKIYDASWYELIRQLQYKSKWNGKICYQIDTYYPSSQTCSRCGSIDKNVKDLKGKRVGMSSFYIDIITIIANTCYNIKNDCYKVGKTYKFKINERLKVRNIRPLTNIEAESRDTSEIEHLAKGGPISFADYYVLNNGSIDEYHKNLERILNDIEV